MKIKKLKEKLLPPKFSLAFQKFRLGYMPGSA